MLLLGSLLGLRRQPVCSCTDSVRASSGLPLKPPLSTIFKFLDFGCNLSNLQT
jgi:hypothetical protein